MGVKVSLKSKSSSNDTPEQVGAQWGVFFRVPGSAIGKSRLLELYTWSHDQAESYQVVQG